MINFKPLVVSSLVKLSKELEQLAQERERIDARTKQVIAEIHSLTAPRTLLTAEIAAAALREEGATNPQKALALLRERPGASFRELAKHLFNDEDQHEKAADVVSYLAKQGKVRQIERGKWEVAP